MATDPVSETLIFDDGFEMPINLLGPSNKVEAYDENEDEWIFNYNFKVKQIFEHADGKYSQVFGNVVFIDCNYVYVTLIKSIKT